MVVRHEFLAPASTATHHTLLELELVSRVCEFQERQGSDTGHTAVDPAN